MIRSADPRTGDPFGPSLPEADRQAVDTAMTAALQAQAALEGCGADRIAAGLRAVAAALDDERAELVALADAETALGTARLEGEVARTSGQLRSFADLIDTGAQQRVVVSPVPPGGPASEVRKMLVPIGVVVVFAASNFPFAFSVAGGDTASALAAGCAVVVKAHYGHPQTSQRVAQLMASVLSSAGLPGATIQLVHGGSETGRLLVEHPDVSAVGFTGSTMGGRALSDLAAKRDVPIPVFAEQGSLNPLIIAPSACGEGLDSLVATIAGSVCAGGGQFCTKPGIIFVPTTYRDAIATTLADRLAESRPVHLLTEKIHQQFDRALERACAVPGVTTWRADRPEQGFAATPAVLACELTTLVTSPELREELFGPATVVVGLEAAVDLPAAVRALGGNLTGTVHGDADDPWITTAVAVLARQVGRLVYGGVPTGVAVVPAMHHGGPYPASSSSQTTSVGTDAVYRFLRPIAYQDFPPELLPRPLQDFVTK